MASVSTSKNQEVEENYADYFDIMLIGRTGTGKSTTADKLLLANPSGKIYRRKDSHVADQSEDEDRRRKDQAHISTCGDLTMWQIGDDEEDQEMVRSRLNSLAACQKEENPHERLSKIREHSKSNPHFELLSNSTSKVRVLDVPGFFSADFHINNTDIQPGNRESAKPHLELMRKIIHIKESCHFKFNRIVYFLPTTGALHRADQVLQAELRTMTFYFRDSIFKCMVVVATYPRDVYDIPDIGRNLNACAEITLKESLPTFKDAMERALEKQDCETPPLVFLSYQETCNNVLDLIKKAKVTEEGVELMLMSTFCTRCNLVLGEVMLDDAWNQADEKIVLCTDLSQGTKINYSESSCHPMLLPKYTHAQRFVGGIAHLITLQKFANRWPGFRNFVEICISCGNGPGTRGCMRVGTAYCKKCKRCRTCKRCVFFSDQCRASKECNDSCKKCQICASCQNCHECENIKVDHSNVIEKYIIEKKVMNPED